MSQRVQDPGRWIAEIIEKYVSEAPENSLGLSTGEKAFDNPLVGFSSGADNLFKEFKNHIGNFYYTPMELFQKTFPGVETEPSELVIISWIIPSTARTREEQAAQKKYPSER